LAAKLTGWRVDVTKPAEGEIYEEPVEEMQEALSFSPRRERSSGRHEREGSSRRSRGSGRY